MAYYVGNMPVGEHLEHHGIKGMRWGQRRYQNSDGSLTAAGRMRYGVSNAYGRARSGVRSAGNRAGSWYKKNKKTIRRVAAGVGTAAAVAGAAYLGKRYGKGAVKAARSIGRKAKAYAKTPWYARGVENSVNRGAARSAFKAARTSASQQVNSAFAGMGIKGQKAFKARNAFKRATGAAKVNTKVPWYARGVENSVNRGAARSASKAARASSSQQVNSAFAGMGIKGKKASKTRDAVKRAKGAAKEHIKAPWYARGVENSVNRGAARSASKAARASSSQQVNSAFAGMGIKGKKASKTRDAVKRATEAAGSTFKRASGTAGYYASKAKNGVGNAVNSARRKGYKAKSGVVGSSGRLGGKRAVNAKGAKQARYPGWMKDTARAYAGSAKRTAGKAKDKVKSTAKRYNDYMNGNSRFVKSWTYRGGYDPRGLWRSGFSPNYYTRRQVARNAVKSFGKGFAIGAAPGVAVTGVAYGASKYAAYKNKKNRAAQRKNRRK